MASVIQNNFRVRKNYAKINKIIDIPNLIDIQKQSYEKFLQKDIPQDQREDVGLQGVFKSVFPIKDFSETSSLEFVSYNLDKPKYDVDECRQRGMTLHTQSTHGSRSISRPERSTTGRSSTPSGPPSGRPATPATRIRARPSSSATESSPSRR